MCKSALLYSKRDYSLSEAIKFICREQRVNLTYCLTFPELLHQVISSNPEIVFFDEENVNFKYEIYQDFINTRLFDIPKIVVITNEPEKFTCVSSDIFIVDKRDYSAKVVNILNSTIEKQAKAMTVEKIEELRTKITKLLGELGVTTKYLGYEYIRELVIEIISDRRMLQSFNTKLYPKLAAKYNTQVNNVERNIRNAIGIAIAHCKNRTLFDDICGRSCLNNANTVPSNKQFITWLAEKVG